MKKSLLIVCVTLAVFLCLSGCHKPANSAELPSTVYQNMDSFLASWTSGKGDGSAGVNSVGTVASVVVPVPVLKSEQYELYYIEAHSSGYTYFYYYVPVDYEKSFFDYDVGIVIGWTNQNGSFASNMEHDGLTPKDGVAYDADRNTWNLDVDGQLLYVEFPKTLPITTEAELYSYFDFEEYTVSGNSGEIQ